MRLEDAAGTQLDERLVAAFLDGLETRREPAAPRRRGGGPAVAARARGSRDPARGHAGRRRVLPRGRRGRSRGGEPASGAGRSTRPRRASSASTCCRSPARRLRGRPRPQAARRSPGGAGQRHRRRRRHLEARLVKGTAHGHLDLNHDGSFTYGPTTATRARQLHLPGARRHDRRRHGGHVHGHQRGAARAQRPLHDQGRRQDPGRSTGRPQERRRRRRRPPEGEARQRSRPRQARPARRGRVQLRARRTGSRARTCSPTGPPTAPTSPRSIRVVIDVASEGDAPADADSDSDSVADDPSRRRGPTAQARQDRRLPSPIRHA